MSPCPWKTAVALRGGTHLSHQARQAEMFASLVSQVVGAPMGQRRGRPTQFGAAVPMPIGSADEQGRYEICYHVLQDSEIAVGATTQAVLCTANPTVEPLIRLLYGNTRVVLIKVRIYALRLPTPQPQLHATDAPWRLCVFGLAGGQASVIDWEDWSARSPQQRCHSCQQASPRPFSVLFSSARPRRSRKARLQPISVRLRRSGH